MRSLLTNYFMVLLLSAVATNTSFGQITLTLENFNRPAVFSDTSYQIPSDGVPVPVPAEDGFWDFSDLEYQAPRIENYTENTNPLIPRATSSEAVSIVVPPFPIPAAYYYELSEERLSFVGESIEDTRYSIAPLTGGPTDSIRFVGGTYGYTNDGNNDIEFPLAFGDQWTSPYRKIIPYELSVAAFGLANTPGEITSNYVTEREVVGYGRVRLPALEGGLEPFADVLMVYLTRVQIDSVYLGGAPAPPAILDAFQFTQGSVTTDTLILFYGMSDIASPMVNFAIDSETITFRPRASGNLTSTRTLQLLPSNVFPNPVAAGREITLDLTSVLPAGSRFQLIGMDGRVAMERPLSGATTTRNTVRLPNNLPAATYIYVLRSEAGNVFASGKLEVR